jgi:hypothetical protein
MQGWLASPKLKPPVDDAKTYEIHEGPNARSKGASAGGFFRHFAGIPSPTTVAPSRFHSAAKVAALHDHGLLRIAFRASPQFEAPKRNGPSSGEAETVILGAMPGAARHKADVGYRPADANKFRVTTGLRCFFVEPIRCARDVLFTGGILGAPGLNQRRQAIIFRLGGAVLFSGLF